ncbi:MAG: type IV pilus modification protein PilV [Pseudomonas sp.]|nr:type IV pilus modification protein PilV [Pseudomonas sp.]
MPTGKFMQWFAAHSHAPDSKGLMSGDPRFYQMGVSLVEVLIAVLVLSVGVLGAASLQLNAIRYSASTGHSTQAAIIARDMLDRMRANHSALPSYATASVSGSCAANSGGATIVTADIADFTQAVTCQLPDADASIAVAGGRATVSISWSESRVQANAAASEFVVSAVVR